MKKIPFSVLDASTFVDHVVTRIVDGPANGRPAFSLVLGSGFSFPLIPTAAGMVKQDIAWWKYAQRQNPPSDFTDEPPVHVTQELTEFSRAMWSSVQADTQGIIQFSLDAATGLPADGADNIAQAYQALMSGRAPKGLSTPELRRRYFRAVCKRVGRKINLAHLYLGSLLHGQTQEAWTKQGRVPFARTILTTNFDPLLQRALQLHNVLYFMSDQPEGGIAPSEDEDQAVHLLYTHGSVHRRHLANTASDIGGLCAANTPALSPYLARQGVIVVGYSGWNDTTFRALESCFGFEGNLYWCGRESGQQAAYGSLRDEVVAFLSQNTENRFYVTLGPGGANDLMYRLHKALLGQLPSIVLDPMGLVIDELEAVIWPEKTTPGLFDGLEQMAHDQIRLLRAFKHGDPTQTTLPSAGGLSGDGELSAVWLLTRAMAAYHEGDMAEAIRHLTLIETNMGATIGQRAKAIYYRGIIKGELAPPDVIGAIADYDAVVAMADAPADQRAMALVNRGVARSRLIPPDNVGAIEDYDAVVAMADASVEQRAMALVNRGVARSRLIPPDSIGAIEDYDAVLAMADASSDQRAQALVNRGVAKSRMTPADTSGAIADCNAVLAMIDAPAEQQANALLNRGVARGLMISPDTAGAIADYDLVLAMADASAELRASALLNRGIAKKQMIPSESAAAIADYDRVVAMDDAPAEHRAKALINRGGAKRLLSPPDTFGAIADYDAVLVMADVPAEQRAMALVNRGAAKSQLNPPDCAGEIIDYDAVLAMIDAPAEQQAKALVNRGVAKSRMIPVDSAGAIADCDAVLAMADAPAEQRVRALVNRGVTRAKMQPPDMRGAVSDTEAALAMPEADTDQKIRAEFNLACFAALSGDVATTLRWLQQWCLLEMNATRAQLDCDTDFDAIRTDPAFVAFRDGLPAERAVDTE